MLISRSSGCWKFRDLPRLLRWRHVGILVGTVIVSLLSLHIILSIAHEDYGHKMSLSRLATKWIATTQKCPAMPTSYSNDTVWSPPRRKANAAFVILVRNSELYAIMDSMKQLEDRFNHKFQYPYVFLNDEPFTDEFKKLTTSLTDASCSYGLIPREHWVQPDWIDEEKASAARLKMEHDNVIYGGSLSYRNMCRYNSGFFFRHELVQSLDYYWRVEPGVEFYCDLDYDPFLLMQDEGKVYGFTISLYEHANTIPTLWDATKEFIEEYPELVEEENALSFISDDRGKTYNRCHFWSNFEIADVRFWRSVPYMKYFEHLESKGGFYYERWGDAPVHSIGVGLFARKEQIHFFNDIGYKHWPFAHCPSGCSHARGNCSCDPASSFDYDWNSCLGRFENLLT